MQNNKQEKKKKQANKRNEQAKDSFPFLFSQDDRTINCSHSQVNTVLSRFYDLIASSILFRQTQEASAIRCSYRS